jgi:hypothetical protein
MALTLEKTQIKFTKSEETGEIIGFVSRHSKTKKLKGVREDSGYGKQVCVLSLELKGKIIPNLLYNVELKTMHNRNGYVVVSAEPVLFKALVEMVVIPNITYQVQIKFGNKTVYFDPLFGRTQSSKTIEGVLKVLNGRKDVEDLDSVVKDFEKKANLLIKKMNTDGFY